jgi:hypothetical protein
MTCAEEFPPGTRIIVHAPTQMDGSDYAWHRCTGTIVEWRGWAVVAMDKAKRDWPNGPIYITPHHIRRA